MVNVKKSFGTFPEDIVVLSTLVTFNEDGIADIEDQEVLDVLSQVPGYVVDVPSDATEVQTEEEDKKVVEDVEEVKEAPTDEVTDEDQAEEKTEAPTVKAKANGLKRNQPNKK